MSSSWASATGLAVELKAQFPGPISFKFSGAWASHRACDSESEFHWHSCHWQ